MAIEKETIERTIQLAKVYFSEEEKAELTHQLSDILSYVEKINELDTSKVEATDHIADLKNVFRTDTVIKSLDKAEIEKIAPQFENDHFVVPKIIDAE